jgi:hypothetical protein
MLLSQSVATATAMESKCLNLDYLSCLKLDHEKKSEIVWKKIKIKIKW